MANANWSNPQLTSTYTNFVSEVKNRDEDLALQFDGTTSTNIPTNAIRWDSTANRWKKWSGTAWGELTSTYALTGLTTTGAATIGTTLGVTGAITGSSTITGTALIPSGSSAPTNGIYLPSANNVAIATNSNGRLFVDASGKVGINNGSPQGRFESAAGDSTDYAIVANNNYSSGDQNYIRFNASTTAIGSINRVTNDIAIKANYAGVSFWTGTGGTATQKALIDSSGNLGLGVTPSVSYGKELSISADTASGVGGLGVRNFATGNNVIYLSNNVKNAGAFSNSYWTTAPASKYEQNQGIHSWYNAPSGTAGNTISFTQAMTLDASGRLGLGTMSPSQPLHVVGAIASTGQASSLTASSAFIDFNSSFNGTRVGSVGNTTGAAGPIYFSQYSSNASIGRDAVIIDSSGRLGIGTTSPSQLLHVSGGYSLLNGLRISGADTSNSIYQATAFGLSSGDYITFSTSSGGPFERMRIDSSGKVGIGTIGPLAKLDITGSIAPLILQSTTSATNYITHKHPSSGDIAYLGGGGGGALTGGTTSDYGIRANLGSIIFACNGDNERARIIASGFTKHADDGAYIGASASYHEFNSSVNNDVLKVRATNASYTSSCIATSTSLAAGTASYFVYGTANAVNTFQVLNNGNVKNINNSYTAISDQKLKESIVDAKSQWADIKALRIVNFKFKEETGLETYKQIGLIAQEVEAISPGLVDETPEFEEVEVSTEVEKTRPVLDEDGNETTETYTEIETSIERQLTGETIKGVKYSILYMKAIKALQEAMQRIEQLEAKVTALEAN
jgi:hypothetical protein